MSAYMLSQLIKPDWANQISNSTTQRPPRPPRPRLLRPPSSRKKEEPIDGVMRELKGLIINGVKSAFENFDHKPPKNREE